MEDWWHGMVRSVAVGLRHIDDDAPGPVFGTVGFVFDGGEGARSAWSRSFWSRAACLAQRPESGSEMAMRQRRPLGVRCWQWSRTEVAVIVELEISGFMRVPFGHKRIVPVPTGAGTFRFGNCWYTPRQFRKSGKQRGCGIRNLEEDTEDGRQGEMMEGKSRRA